jgi:hypothetical protein
MSTIYETLITAGLKPEANEAFKDHVSHTWKTGVKIPEPNFDTVPLAVNTIHMAMILAVSADARVRLLPTDRAVLFTGILNEALAKLRAMYKTEPVMDALYSNCCNAEITDLEPEPDEDYDDGEDNTDDHDEDGGGDR